MTEVTNRNEVRSGIAAGGWTIVWGDLINEFDVLTFAISIPTGTIGAWVSEQVEAQLQKFSQSLDDVSDDVVKQATDYLKDLMKGKNSGERDINGLGVKGGFATYNRKMILKVFGKQVGSTPLPNNHQPYIGLRVTKPLPPKGTNATTAPVAPTVPLFDTKSWYKIKNTAKPGLALDVVNDGNQQHDGRLQTSTEGNLSGQYWQLRPSKTSHGAYNLCTMWLGTNMLLDVYGDDKTRPHLAKAGAYSGQQWHIESQGNGTWKLTNSYSGTLVLAADADGSELHLRDPRTSPASQWTLQIVRPITENGFGL
ncbi:uncharacterized protein ALTATR162_LOCUS12070 [Alternaria atra]|uniref:Ricin B lectin domain-containing protein n=1 Tax=Alternaria atra TaxID=119953 RepID=A0A8J2IDZ7_9PLEO|nr:uncharacterized protein ALTATR162_LOCUS12070 [Alternaria atra]CAG5188964.1 unnamed protein product [Alternaria atra]